METLNVLKRRESEDLDKLAKALSQAQILFKVAKKDQDNPFFKSKYADLTSVWDACREALSKNELSVSQICELTEGGNCIIITKLMHASGQWIESSVPCYVKDKTPQALGSAITYARRYGLSAIVGVTTDEDDDGEAAEKAFKNKPPVAPK